MPDRALQDAVVCESEHYALDSSSEGDSLTEKAVRKSNWERVKALPSYLKSRKKDLFVYWIIYQTIKGLLTTSLIWVPLFYIWMT